MTRWLAWVQQNRDVAFVALIVVILVVIFVPVPTAIIDLLLVMSISLSLLTLMTVIYTKEPLSFSVFPSLLLVGTGYRLALNIATTRLILSKAGELETAAAGKVIQAFGQFVAAGDVVIGLVVFSVVMVVNFVVITKGANRISEVAARFTLDAMPGKQMAIDADLNSGLIKEAEARARRERIAREADFYGAMDGATKFVRGDAVAGIIVTLINIIGGLILGTIRYGMAPLQALDTFTILTVGDGLVSQVPALLTSLAAGLMVTRATAQLDLGRDFMGQIFSQKQGILIAGVFLVGLAFTGMPIFQSVLVGGALVGLFELMRRASRKAQEKERTQKQQEEARKTVPEKVDALLHVDPMELEVGHGLLRLVDPAQGGPILDRITRIRRQLAVDLGLVVPPVRIRDNIQLEPNQYVVKIKGSVVARGEVMPDMHLAMESGVSSGPLTGIPTKEPVFGLRAYWVPEAERARAESMGYTVVEPSAVMATHLTEIIKRHAADLLTREEVHNLIRNLRQVNPAIVEEVVDKVLKAGEIQKVLQNLLREGVSVRDLSSILEVLGDYGARTKDPEILTEYVRNALGRGITQRLMDREGKIAAITLDPRLEDMIRSAIERTEHGSYLTLSPAKLQRVTQQIAREVEQIAAKGKTPVVLCSPQVRYHVKRIVDTVDPTVAVVSFNEVAKEARVEAMAMVGPVEEVEPAGRPR